MELPPSSNDMSNYDTIQALVEKGTFQIDDSLFATADKVKLNDHFYSVRPPVLPFLASGVYWIASNSASLEFAKYPNLVSWLLVVSVCGVSSAVACLCVNSNLRQIDDHIGEAHLSVGSPTLAALSLGLASLMLPYSVVFNHHIVAAGLDMIAIWILHRAQLHNRHSIFGSLVAGICAGLAATIDLAGGGVFLLAILGWTVSSSLLRPRLFSTFIGAFLCAIFHFALNYSITGDLRPLLLRNDLIQASAMLRTDELSGFLNHKNIGSFGQYVFGMLLGQSPLPRGLFLYSPCVFYGWLAGWKITKLRKHPMRLTAVWLLIASVSLVCYLCVFTNNYSGTNYGIRWFVLLLPSAYLLMYAGWSLLTFWQKSAAIFCQIWSGFIAWIGVARFTWQDWDVFPFLSELRWVIFGVLILSLVMPGDGKIKAR